MIYIFGGYYNETFLAQCEVYDIENNKWNEIAPLSCARYQTGAAALDRYVNCVVLLQKSTNSRNNLQSMNSLSYCTSFLLKLQLYCFCTPRAIIFANRISQYPSYRCSPRIGRAPTVWHPQSEEVFLRFFNVLKICIVS